MPSAAPTCRCGHVLAIPSHPPERMVCPACGAKIRLRRTGSARSSSVAPGSLSTDDGYIRFFCPCGRKLKVSASQDVTHGRCPDCGRVVPVPTTATPDAPTSELTTGDQATLQAWTDRHLNKTAAASAAPVSNDRVEVGLRVCPKCGKPLHIAATSCRDCGIPVPRR